MPTYAWAYQALRAAGVSCNVKAATFNNVDELVKFADHWETARLDLPFNTDGLVVKLNVAFMIIVVKHLFQHDNSKSSNLVLVSISFLYCNNNIIYIIVI